MRKDSKNFARHGFLQIATWLRRWDYGVGLRVRVTIVTITVLITIMATIGRQESASSSPLDSQLQTTEDSALQEQLHRTLWESLYTGRYINYLLWSPLSFRKLNETLSKENAMFHKFLNRLDPKDIQVKGVMVRLKKQWLPRSDVVCWPPPQHSQLSLHLRWISEFLSGKRWGVEAVLLQKREHGSGLCASLTYSLQCNLWW